MKKIKCSLFSLSVAIGLFFQGGVVSAASSLYSQTLDELLLSIRSKNYTQVVDLSVLAFKMEPTPQFFDRWALDDFRKQLTVEDSEILVRAFENDAPEKLKPLLNSKLSEIENFRGDLNQSAAFYFLKYSLENYYLEGAYHSKIWIHRNPAPGDYRVFIIVQGGGFRFLNWPTHTVLGLQMWEEKMTVNRDIAINVAGKLHSIKALPKAILSSDKAKNYVLKLTEKQRDIDYGRICKDGVLRSVFIFGHGQKPAWKNLLDTLLNEAGWDLDETTTIKAELDRGLKEVILEEIKNADYIVKGAHGSGSSAFMKVVRQGFVRRFKRNVPAGAGISERCSGKNLIEEIAVIYPDDRYEKLENSIVNMVPREFLGSILDSESKNGGQTILFDTACSGTPVIKRLYADFVRMSDSNPVASDFKLSIFHSPMKQKTVGYFPGGSLRWMAYVGLRVGFSFDQIWNLPHDELMQPEDSKEKFLDPIIHGPGSNAYAGNRALFDEISEMSTAKGIETDVGVIKVEAHGALQPEEF